MAILNTANACSSKSIQVNDGCSDFCSSIPEPKKYMFEKNLNNGTFDFLVEVSYIRECGCIKDKEKAIDCQKKYIYEKK